MRSLPSSFEPIDNEELELESYLNSSDYTIEAPSKDEKTKLAKLAKEALTAKRQISINLLERDLNFIKARALESGIPYQTIISALVRSYATGKVKVEI